MGIMDNLTDEQILTAMREHDLFGKTYTEIAKEWGATRSSICAMMSRIQKDTDRHDLTPELNGSMPDMWWKR